jgi:hypothetical protein
VCEDAILPLSTPAIGRVRLIASDIRRAITYSISDQVTDSNCLQIRLTLIERVIRICNRLFLKATVANKERCCVSVQPFFTIGA